MIYPGFYHAQGALFWLGYGKIELKPLFTHKIKGIKPLQTEQGRAKTGCFGVFWSPETLENGYISPLKALGATRGVMHPPAGPTAFFYPKLGGS